MAASILLDSNLLLLLIVGKTSADLVEKQTSDAVLCAWPGNRGLDVVNFNHLRDAWREGGLP